MPEVALKGAHLSFQQERLWSFQRGQETYRSQCTVVLNARLDFQAFKQALQQIVEQHTIFRTVFYALPGMDVPVQVLGHSVELHCPIIDLGRIAASQQRTLLETLLTSFQEEVFDLEHGPLFRPVLFRLSVETALLLMSLPALYADATTMPLLIEEIAKRYTANLAGRQLVEEPLQYTAVSAWERQQVTEDSEEAKIAHAFWKKIDLSQATQVQRNLEKIGIVESGNRKYTQDAPFVPLTMPLCVDDDLSARIHALALHHNVSVATVMLTCWLVVLRRLTDEPQLVIGVACDGRNYEELTEAPGLYTRFVPFGTSLEDSWSFPHVLNFVEPLLQEMREYQTYFSWPTTFDETHNATAPVFFPVLFEQERWPASFGSTDLRLKFERRFCYTEPFVLKLAVLQVGERLLVELHYDARMVANERVKRLASMLQTFLGNMIEQPQSQIGAPSLLSAQERKQVLLSSRGPRREWSEQSVQQLFEAQVKQHPNAPAVISRREQWSYQQLNARANQLAQVLRTRGVGVGTVVGLCLEREAVMLVGLLGILKAGGAYLPLDAASPEARLRYQLEESGARWLVTQAGLQEKLPAWAGQTLVLEEVAQELAEADAQDQVREQDQVDALAWVIYTSGSTGKPKGVMVRQSSVVNYTRGMCEQLGAEVGWQYATVSTLAADLGNTAIFCALASGGCVQVLDYETATSGEAMATWAAQHSIDVLKIVPSHLSALLESQHARGLLPQRALVLGGEALPEGLLQRIAALGARCAVYNHYGPTETTVGVLVNALGVQGAEEPSILGGTVPLGRPLANTQVYVLDEQMQVVPSGVRGELYIGGAGVGWGYVGQGGQTAERFVPDPYSEQEGGRLYRTGDRGRRWEDEKIAFEGRVDGQVKLRGYRIELGEIEAVLRQHPEIRDSAIVLREDTAGGQSLVAYIVPRKVSSLADINLHGFLQERLPDYMVPSTFLYVKFLPLTANGKVDRRQLITGGHTVSVIATDSTSRKVIQPRDEVELQLLRIWEEILQAKVMSVFDNFFNIGGHSLLAVRLISHIAEHFEQNLDLATLFQYPTVAELAVVLRQQNGAKEGTPVVAIQSQGTRPAFFCVHPAGGTAFCYVNLARHLGSEQPFYGLHAPFGNSAAGRPWKTLEEMAAHYVTSIQSVQPQGPYLLGGWSLGGVVAFEMAQQLQRRGHEVSVLAIMDGHLSDAQIRAKAVAEGLDLSDTAIVRDFMHTFKIVAPDGFDQRTVDEQFGFAVEEAKKMQVIPVDISTELVWRITCTKVVNEHIKRLYVPGTYEQEIDYFLSDDSIEQIENSDEGEGMTEASMVQGSLQRWRERAKGGFNVHHIPGSHGDMVEEPNVRVLAAALKQCINRQHR